MAAGNSVLSSDLCRKAWEMILPAIEAAAAQGVTNKLAGTLVVLVPDPRREGMSVLYRARIDADHEGAVKYDQIAVKKATVTWKTGLSSRVAQQQAPHLYDVGDTKWGGSVIRDELIVAFSGVQAVFDEMIAGWMADAILALSRNAMADVMAQSGDHVSTLSV